MPDKDVMETIKALSDEQLAKEHEVFTLFTNQFRLQFFDAYALRYWRLLQDEARDRARKKRFDETMVETARIKATWNIT